MLKQWLKKFSRTARTGRTSCLVFNISEQDKLDLYSGGFSITDFAGFASYVDWKLPYADLAYKMLACSFEGNNNSF